MFHQNISMRGPSFLWLTRTLIKVLLFQETSPAPQKVLIVHLLFLCSYCASWRKSTKMFHQNVSMRGPSFLCPTWNFDQSASIPRNFSCPPPKKKVIFYVRHETLIKVLLFQETSPASQKALIAHLLFLFGHILYLLLYTSFIQSSFSYSVSHTMREDIVPLVLSCNRFRNNQIEYWKRQIQNTENRQKQSPRGVL